MTLRDSLARLGACALLALGVLAGPAHAAGTAAGTDINNAAKLDYAVGGINQSQICSSPTGNSTSTCTNTTFKVDNKINLLVTTSDSAPGVSAVPGSTTTLTFVVTNQGNNTQDFAFSTTSGLTGTVGYMFNGGVATTVADTFDPTGCTIYNATNTTAAITSVSGLAADASVSLKVACAIPLGKVNTDVAAVTLIATAQGAGGAALTESTTNDPTVVDIVFADGTGTNEENARDAKYSARSAFKISTAAITVTKNFVTLCDPAGGDATGTPAYVPKSIPGSYVQYTVTIASSNATSVTATLANLSDTLDTTKVTFDTDFINGANAPGNVPGCASTSAPLPNRGTATSTGNSVKVTWSGGSRTSFGGTTGTKYLTAGATYSAPTLTVNWAGVLPAEDAYATAAQLKPGDTLTVVYNVFIK
jgi:hypothetical protein